MEPRPSASSFHHLAVPDSFPDFAGRPFPSIVNGRLSVRPPTPHPFIFPRPSPPFVPSIPFPNNIPEDPDSQTSTPQPPIVVTSPSISPSSSEGSPISPIPIGTPPEPAHNDPTTTLPPSSVPPKPSYKTATHLELASPGSSPDHSSPSTPTSTDSRTFYLTVVAMTLPWLTSMFVLASSTLISLR